MRSAARSAADDPPPAGDRAVMRIFLGKPGFLLARVDQICTSLHAELSVGETLAQAEFLLLIHALGAAPQIALARAAGVDTSTTALVLANLRTRGWVDRNADTADRRRAVVRLTDEGAARMARIDADFAALQARLLAPLADEDAGRLKAMLGRIAASPTRLAPAYEPMGSALDAAPSFLSRRALQLFQAQFLASLRPFNLTPRQFSLLVILGQMPEITQVGFARLFGLDPSTCGVIMRNLAKRGLLDSAPSVEDGRARVYRLTQTGRDVAAGGQPLAEQSERLVFRGESAGDVRWLVRQLQALVHAHSHRLRFPGAIAG